MNSKINIALVGLILLCLAPSFSPAQYQDTERQWEKIYGNRLFELIEERPLAWLPFGVLERHGEHLPWGLDGDKAHLVCVRLAGKMGGVVLPASNLAGVHGDRRPDQDEEQFRRTHREVGDFLFSEGFLHRFLLESFDGLANLGFAVIVAYSGHWSSIQGEILKAAAEEFNSTGKAIVIPFGEIMACGVVDHGAKYESSMWAALVPGGVRMDSIVDYSTGRKDWYRGKEIASQISAEFGEEVLKMIEDYMARELDKAFSSVDNGRGEE
ncbi:MAG: hypothetical protein FVQ81_02645 [Candidatus Glassbacteria bacterium]|nr:hypothetical protein [Candidatus Glassbacteria bacterium]